MNACRHWLAGRTAGPRSKPIRCAASLAGIRRTRAWPTAAACRTQTVGRPRHRNCRRRWRSRRQSATGGGTAIREEEDEWVPLEMCFYRDFLLPPWMYAITLSLLLTLVKQKQWSEGNRWALGLPVLVFGDLKSFFFFKQFSFYICLSVASYCVFGYYCK